MTKIVLQVISCLKLFGYEIQNPKFSEDAIKLNLKDSTGSSLKYVIEKCLKFEDEHKVRLTQNH